MSTEDKVRVSGETPRNGNVSPVLPTVNPASEKPQPASGGIHPALYVV